MKKLLVLVLVLALSSWASAALLISVGGVSDPGPITVEPSDHLVLDVTAVAQATNIGVYMIAQGPGSMSGGVMSYNGVGGLSGITRYSKTDVAYYIDDDPLQPVTWGEWFASVGFADVQSSILFLEFVDTTAPPPAFNGKVVDLIDFHCEGPGVVTVSLLNPDNLAVAYDTQIINQIPEPATIALLCLGGLLIRKK